jgi:hypothetical protein
LEVVDASTRVPAILHVKGVTQGNPNMVVLAWCAVKQSDNPTPEQVAETHARVVQTLKTLFDTHKHLLPGWENKELILV